MAARLLRLALCAWVLAAVGVAASVHAAFGPVAAVAAAAVALLAHVPVLGAQFVAMWLVNGRSWGRVDASAELPTPPTATAAQVVRAWLREAWVFVRVFAWRQAFRSRAVADRLDPMPMSARGRPGVLLVHGFCCNRGLWQDWQRTLQDRGVATLAIDLEPVFGSIDAYAPPVIEAIARLTAATGRPPVVVAHSMGGLAVRAALRAVGPRAVDRVAHVVTIGTPHHGTRAGHLAPVANARQMRIGSPWLASLAASEPADLYARFTCFWSHCDNIVFPAHTATLAGADNRHVEGVPHVALVDAPAVMAAVLAWLDDGRRA